LLLYTAFYAAALASFGGLYFLIVHNRSNILLAVQPYFQVQETMVAYKSYILVVPGFLLELALRTVSPAFARIEALL